jgi:transposase
MAYIEGEDRYQQVLFPDSIDAYIPPDSPVRVIDAFVISLDMLQLGFVRGRAAETGRPGYDPRDLLKLYLYGYLNSLRSSRTLARECGRNIEVMFLLNKLTPDHRTVSDFRKDNIKSLKLTFDAFVRFCDQQALFGKALLAVDGTKIRANNAKAKAYNKKILEEKIARIDAHVAGWLRDLDQQDALETDEPRFSKEEIAAILETLGQRKDTYQSYLEEIGKSREAQLLTTDPDARVMKSKDGFHPSYNVQTAVDEKHGLIAEMLVTNQCNDVGLLHPVVEAAKEALSCDTLEAVADKGYDSNADAKACLLNGVFPQAALRDNKEERVLVLDYEPARIDPETKASTRPHDIEKCLKAGILPDCYQDKDIELKIETPDDSGKDLAYFIRNKDNTVTCPMGRILRQAKMRGKDIIYQNRRACRQCKNRCGKFRDYKTVLFSPDTKAVPVKMPAGSNKGCRITKLPPGMEINPGNHTLYRADSGGRQRVLVILKANKYRQFQRKCLAEHPFGTMKRSLSFGYFLLRGKEKVQAEASLMGLAYNMKRAINLLGAANLITALSG